MRPRQSSEELVELDVRAADVATEIFVIDAQFRRIAQGVGRVNKKVAPGIYKVRYRTGEKLHDELVEVAPSNEPHRVRGDPLMFRSAVPIEHTETSRTGHAKAAERISLSRPTSLGSGSQLFVFCRDTERSDSHEPWTGVGIHQMDGERLIDISEGDTESELRYGGVQVELDPGTYRLRVETGRVGDYEMFVTTSGGWQTQVFILADDFWADGNKVRRASLRDAAVFMKREGDGFSADSEQARLTELARQGLESGRSVIRASDLRDMLWAKYDNPMVAIYGAHLMLLQPRIDHKLLETVMHNLKNLIGPHPDVLALHLRPGAPTPPPGLQFAEPPMLRDSWDLISRASLRRHALVPSGSATDRVADRLLSSRPWLLHRVEDAEVFEDADVSFAEATRMIDTLMSRAEEGEAESLAELIISQPESFSPLEQSIASVTIGSALLNVKDETDQVQPPTKRESSSSIGKLLRSLDAPATSIARSTDSLVKKLETFS